MLRVPSIAGGLDTSDETSMTQTQSRLQDLLKWQDDERVFGVGLNAICMQAMTGG
jgi:hypothetical protein